VNGYAERRFDRGSVAAGAGVGAEGPQVATIGRVRFGSGLAIFGLGSGLSYGDSEVHAGFRTYRVEHGAWWNGEMFYEARADDGTTIRLTAGLGAAFASGACEVDAWKEEPVDCDGDAVIHPYTGLWLGQSF